MKTIYHLNSESKDNFQSSFEPIHEYQMIKFTYRWFGKVKHTQHLEDLIEDNYNSN